MKYILFKVLIAIAVSAVFTYGLYSAAESEKRVQQQIENAVDEY